MIANRQVSRLIDVKLLEEETACESQSITGDFELITGIIQVIKGLSDNFSTTRLRIDYKSAFFSIATLRSSSSSVLDANPNRVPLS